jgi:hypothetical protein
VGTVGAEQIPSAQLALLAGLDVLRRQGDAVRVLLDPDRLVAVEHLCAGRFGAAAQDRLETGLGDEQPPAGTERIDALVEARDDVGELLAGERVHDDQRAFRLELLARLLAHLVLDAGRAEHLERAHVEEGGARKLRAAAQTLHCERGDSVLRQEHRGRQADQPTAGDQYGHVGFDGHWSAHRILP